MVSSLTSTVDLLQDARKFMTPGREGRGKHDPVGYVLGKFFNSTPEFDKSLVERQRRKNGWTLRGAWPSTGRKIFDWEFDVWGERGGEVVVKFAMWSNEGLIDGLSFRTNVGTVDRLIPKFLRKYFYPMKAMAKERAA